MLFQMCLFWSVQNTTTNSGTYNAPRDSSPGNTLAGLICSENQITHLCSTVLTAALIQPDNSRLTMNGRDNNAVYCNLLEGRLALVNASSSVSTLVIALWPCWTQVFYNHSGHLIETSWRTVSWGLDVISTMIPALTFGNTVDKRVQF